MVKLLLENLQDSLPYFMSNFFYFNCVPQGDVLLLRNADSTLQPRETKVGEDHQFEGSAPRIGPLR